MPFCMVKLLRRQHDAGISIKHFVRRKNVVLSYPGLERLCEKSKKTAKKNICHFGLDPESINYKASKDSRLRGNDNSVGIFTQAVETSISPHRGNTY